MHGTILVKCQHESEKFNLNYYHSCSYKRVLEKGSCLYHKFLSIFTVTKNTVVKEHGRIFWTIFFSRLEIIITYKWILIDVLYTNI